MALSDRMLELAATAIMNRRIQPDFYGVDKNNFCLYDTDKELAKAALTAALSDQVVVPRVPTQRMIEAGDAANPTVWNEGTPDDFGAGVASDIYDAMIAAAPPPEPAGNGGVAPPKR